MATPRVLVLRAPGTNCDLETAFAFERCGAQADQVHLFRLLEEPRLADDYQVLCIPGGFSYGDDVGAGVIFANQLRNRLADSLHNFLQQDKLILGICNGFQVLLKAGVLPDGQAGWPPRADQPAAATLTWNNNGKYTARWVHLRTAGSDSIFLRGIDDVELPIAHAEGKIEVQTPDVLDRWREQRQIALCYARPCYVRPAENRAAGEELHEPLPFPENPNGSVANIAGLCDPTGRVLGLMPHPERFLFATQHPQWTRRPRTSDEGAGQQLFRNAVEYFG